MSPEHLEFVAAPAVAWLIPGREAENDYDAAEGCRQCDKYADCSGPPRDYTDRFGWTEIRSQENQYVGVVGERIPIEAGAVKPPPRAGRAPATKLSFSVNQSARPTLGGDPLLGVKPNPVAESLRVTFGAPARIQHPVLGDEPALAKVESTRAIRQRLVNVSQQGARCLRVASAGSLAHPNVGSSCVNVADCRWTKLKFVARSGLASLTDREIRRMRGITRFYFALYAPNGHGA